MHTGLITAKEKQKPKKENKTKKKQKETKKPNKRCIYMMSLLHCTLEGGPVAPGPPPPVNQGQSPAEAAGGRGPRSHLLRRCHLPSAPGGRGAAAESDPEGRGSPSRE